MKKTTRGTIRVGVGGWNYAPWRGTFYPAKHPQSQELQFASSHLTSIEINSTYYGSQKRATFIKWHEETPQDFVFSVKAPRYATNRRVLAEAGATIERFLASGVTELKQKLGPINWQFLPTKTFDPTDCEAFLKLLPKQADGIALRHAIEARHESFHTPEFVAMARKHGVAIVRALDSQYPLIEDATTPFTYARVMGTEEKKPLGYSTSDLDRWAERVKAWASEGKVRRDVYLYFISGHKVVNPQAAMALIQRIG